MIILRKFHIYFRFQSFLMNKDNNEAVMTVLEDLVRSDLGEKSGTVPDISDDAKEYFSDSKVIILINLGVLIETKSINLAFALY